jgi:hypothetical protein
MKLDLVAVFIIIVVLLPPLANVPDGYQLDGIPTILLKLVCWPYLFHNLVINNVKSSLILMFQFTKFFYFYLLIRYVDLASLLLFLFFILLGAITSYFHLLIRYVDLAMLVDIVVVLIFHTIIELITAALTLYITCYLL